MAKPLWPIAGTTGLVIDVPIIDGNKQPVDLTLVTNQRIDVQIYGSDADPVAWPATPEDGGILRHVVPDDAPLAAGTYILNPYIELPNGFKGSWGPVVLIVLGKGEVRK